MIDSKALRQIQLRYFRRGVKKSEIFARAYLMVLFWIFEVLIFFLVKDQISTLPVILVALLILAFALGDFFYKLISQHDTSVMNAYLKTRPVSPRQWEKYLVNSQFWKPSNLFLPAALLPICFMLLPSVWALVTLAVLYFLSVLSGIIVMNLKRNGPYESERESQSAQKYSGKDSFGKNIFGIQTKSFFRSKRLKTAIFFLLPLLYLNSLTIFGIFGEDSLTDDPISSLTCCYLFMLVYMPGAILAQYGNAIEANFFSGIWTKPISYGRILKDKYYFFALLDAVSGLICLPLCLFGNADIDQWFACLVFGAGFCNLTMLIDPYNCVPFDLFGKAFFNYQGASTAYRASVFIAIFGELAMVIAGSMLLPRLWFDIVFSVLGILGICFHQPVFKYVEKRFLANRHKHIEKYLSKV